MAELFSENETLRQANIALRKQAEEYKFTRSPRNLQKEEVVLENPLETSQELTLTGENFSKARNLQLQTEHVEFKDDGSCSPENMNRLRRYLSYLRSKLSKLMV